jgi:hypothetical protein
LGYSKKSPALGRANLILKARFQRQSEAKSLCRVAPSVLFNARAIFPAGVFFRASVMVIVLSLGLFGIIVGVADWFCSRGAENDQEISSRGNGRKRRGEAVLKGLVCCNRMAAVVLLFSVVTAHAMGLIQPTVGIFETLTCLLRSRRTPY